MSDSSPAEVRALRHFLNAQRASVRAIIEGLDEMALHSVVMPSGWSPLGLVEHLGHAERFWFQHVATGSMADLPWTAAGTAEDGAGAPLVSTHSAEDVLAFYLDQCDASDAVLASSALDSPPAAEHGIDLQDKVMDLRWIALHMIEETARHAGHLDIARELIDGRVGLGPR